MSECPLCDVSGSGAARARGGPHRKAARVDYRPEPAQDGVATFRSMLATWWLGDVQLFPRTSPKTSQPGVWLHGCSGEDASGGTVGKSRPIASSQNVRTA